MAVEVQERAERFAREIGEMRIDDPSAGRSALWLRVGAVLMAAGLVAGVAAVVRSQGTTDPLIQRDSLAIALTGIAAAVVGAALYLRYSITKVLRFWLARLSFDLDERNRAKG